MWFKDEETFVNYTQLIPGFFIIIWIVQSYWVEYAAPHHADETIGRVYQVVLKGGGIVYLTLTEEILWKGSIILAITSGLILILIKLHYWGDEKA